MKLTGHTYACNNLIDFKYSICNYRKRKSCKSAEIDFEKLVKSHQVNLFLARFSHLESLCDSADQLMYVKEDLILPQTNTFYDFIVTKARGKSGPLFTFDVKEDIRLQHDASIEKDESHAGKVVLRNWYERNKHIFPASRWEPYDPTKTYEKYTCHDRKKTN